MKHFYCNFRVQHPNLHKSWYISFLQIAKSEIFYISVIIQKDNIRKNNSAFLYSNSNVIILYDAYFFQLRQIRVTASRAVFVVIPIYLESASTFFSSGYGS
jgi:hypothetical protein